MSPTLYFTQPLIPSLKMSLKIVQNFDSSFTLAAEAKEILFKLLNNENFLTQIAQQLPVTKLEFTGNSYPLQKLNLQS